MFFHLLNGENLAPRRRGPDVDHEDLLPLQLLDLGLLASLLGLDAQQAAEKVKADLHLLWAGGGGTKKRDAEKQEGVTRKERCKK